jgi:hypothetical protein
MFDRHTVDLLRRMQVDDRLQRSAFRWRGCEDFNRKTGNADSLHAIIG